MPDSQKVVEVSEGEADEKIPRRKRGRWRRRILKCVAALAIVYLVSLLLLNTGWFKGKITSKLEQKSGLVWEVDRVMWLPFSDVSIHGLHSSLGDGEVAIDSISIRPVWGQCLKGDLVYTDIELDGMVVDVDQLWLEAFLKNKNAAVPAERVSPKKPQPKPIKPQPPIKKPTKLAPVAPKKRGQNQKPKQKVELKFGAEKWLNVKNLTLRVRKGEKVLFEKMGMSLSVPYSGEKAEGYVRFSADGDEGSSLPLQWNGQELSAKWNDFEVLGLKINGAIAVRPMRHAVPYLVQVNVQQRDYKAVLDRPNLKLHASAEQVTAQFSLRGNLSNVHTWNGAGLFVAKGTSVHEDTKTHKMMVFDHVMLQARIISGNLYIENAQAVGEELSFMANGVVQSNLYSYGVMRCVANEAKNAALMRIYHGSKVLRIDKQKYNLLELLDNRDRYYMDIFADGKLTDLEIRHNRSDGWQSLNALLAGLKKFKDDELAEDGLLVSPDKK